MKNYVITEFSEKFGWCLYKVLYGQRTEEEVKALVKKEQANYNKPLRFEIVEEKDCWWNE